MNYARKFSERVYCGSQCCDEQGTYAETVAATSNVMAAFYR